MPTTHQHDDGIVGTDHQHDDGTWHYADEYCGDYDGSANHVNVNHAVDNDLDRARHDDFADNFDGARKQHNYDERGVHLDDGSA